jgi:hemoglobin
MIVAALLLALLAPAGRSFAQEKPTKTLYQRLGGYDVIAGIVDDFIAQLRVDPAFKRFGGGRSMDSLHRTRQLVVDQICNLSGGPCVYIGRDMKTAHAGLQITEAEWDSSIKKFQVSLDKFKVAEPEQQDFLAMIGKLKSDIVEPPKQENPKAETPQAQN